MGFMNFNYAFPVWDRRKNPDSIVAVSARNSLWKGRLGVFENVETREWGFRGADDALFKYGGIELRRIGNKFEVVIR